MKTVGHITLKKYRCRVCGHEEQISTNHWGSCYSFGNYNTCPSCPPYKRPNIWDCQETPPEGYAAPKAMSPFNIEPKHIIHHRKNKRNDR